MVLTPRAEQIKEFVEALLELNSWRVSKSRKPTISLMEWRHHSIATTRSVLGHQGDYPHDRWAARRLLEEEGFGLYFVQTGNPIAIREWLAERELKHHWPFKSDFALECWSLEQIRDELTRQEVVRWWPEQAMRIIAFVTLRDNIVSDLDYERLSSLNRAQLGRQVRELGRSRELQLAHTSQKSRKVARREASPRHESGEIDVKFEKWLKAGKPWIRGARLEDPAFSSFLLGLYGAGIRWPTAKGANTPRPRDPHWLDELLARAEDLAPLLRFEPAWPTTFQDGKSRVTITVVDTTLVGWVEIGRFKTLVAVDIESWEVASRSARGEDDVAAGLVIGWYLDSCICLRKRSHPHFKLGSHPRGSTGRPVASHAIYLPTPQFRSDVRSVSRGTREAPRAHRVRGHVRELSSLRNPSVKARNNAPWYIRRHLKHHETFVQSHSRGKGGKSREMAVYLSKYSTLADALGSLS